MSLATDLETWASQLPAWSQQLLLACLDRYPTDEEIAEAAELLLENPALVPEKALVDRSSFDFESRAGSASILAIGDIEHVNRFGRGVGLTFASSGMTACYGRNGAGKTGYARLAKWIGRTLAPEPVLSNVFDETRTPQATIDWLTPEGPGSMRAKLTEPKVDTPLSEMAVFDDAGADQYLVDGTEVDYVPPGLAAMSRLGESVDKVRRLVDEMAAQVEVPPLPIEVFPSETAVGRLLRTDEPRIDELKKLATLSEEEDHELQELRRDVALAETGRAEQIAGEESRRGRVLQDMADLMSHGEALFRPSSGRSFEARVGDVLEARKLADEATRPMSADCVVEGVGTPAWGALFEAVENFAEEFLGETFPPKAKGARCPACLQVIDESARERLSRLRQAIHSSARQQADVLTASLRRDLSDLPRSAETESALARVQEVLPDEHDQELRLKCQEWARRYSAVWTAVSEVTGAATGPAAEAPIQELQERAARAQEQAKQLARLDEAPDARALKTRLLELSARAELRDRWAAVEGSLRRAAERRHFEESAKAANTGAISRKKREFSSALVTEEFQAEFERQAKNLRFDSVEVQCKTREVKGVTQRTLAFSSRSGESLKAVLSQGERRRLALVIYLAELEFGFRRRPAFLDDPVSSLDVDGRSYVATLLAKLALERQVIVLTHDLPFLLELDRAARNTSAPLEFRTIFESGGACGFTSESLPWDGKNASKRLRALKESLQRLEALKATADPSYDAEARSYCTDYRQTLERIVLEEAVGDVVARQHDRVKLTALRGIGVDARVIQLVDHALDLASQWIHDRDDDASAPDPQSLKEAQSVLVKLRKAIEAASKALKREHEKLIRPAPTEPALAPPEDNGREVVIRDGRAASVATADAASTES